MHVRIRMNDGDDTAVEQILIRLQQSQQNQRVEVGIGRSSTGTGTGTGTSIPIVHAVVVFDGYHDDNSIDYNSYCRY
jgi:hypothetical protein